MRLYNRDFCQALTNEEKEAVSAETDWKTNKNGIFGKNNLTAPRFSHKNLEIRDFIWKNTSLFPNNFLNPITVKELDHDREKELFVKELDKAKNEQQIQSYIKKNLKWFIPATIFKEYHFGNHGAYLFPEQKLYDNYQVDYLLLGKNSDGYNMVLVEFESPNCGFVQKTSNDLISNVRKGLTQISDWKIWMDNNRNDFIRNNFGKINSEIPTSRIYYCLVVSRRELMDEKAQSIRSQKMYESKNLKIITYDRLADYITELRYGY